LRVTALVQPAHQLETWLAALDASKTRLKPTLSALLQQHAEHETDDFLKDLARFTSGAARAGEGDGGTADVAPAPAIGGVVGPYRLLSPVGQGRMSSVWLGGGARGGLGRKGAP